MPETNVKPIALRVLVRGPDRKLKYFFIDAITQEVLSSTVGYEVYSAATDTAVPNPSEDEGEDEDRGSAFGDLRRGIPIEHYSQGNQGPFDGQINGLRDAGQPVDYNVDQDGTITATNRTPENGFGYIAPSLATGIVAGVATLVNPAIGIATIAAQRLNNIAAINAYREHVGKERLTPTEALKATLFGAVKAGLEEDIQAIEDLKAGRVPLTEEFSERVREEVDRNLDERSIFDSNPISSNTLNPNLSGTASEFAARGFVDPSVGQWDMAKQQGVLPDPQGGLFQGLVPQDVAEKNFPGLTNVQSFAKTIDNPVQVAPQSFMPGASTSFNAGQPIGAYDPFQDRIDQAHSVANSEQNVFNEGISNNDSGFKSGNINDYAQEFQAAADYLSQVTGYPTSVQDVVNAFHTAVREDPNAAYYTTSALVNQAARDSVSGVLNSGRFDAFGLDATEHALQNPQVFNEFFEGVYSPAPVTHFSSNLVDTPANQQWRDMMEQYAIGDLIDVGDTRFGLLATQPGGKRPEFDPITLAGSDFAGRFNDPFTKDTSFVDQLRSNPVLQGTLSGYDYFNPQNVTSDRLPGIVPTGTTDPNRNVNPSFGTFAPTEQAMQGKLAPSSFYSSVSPTGFVADPVMDPIVSELLGANAGNLNKLTPEKMMEYQGFHPGKAYSSFVPTAALNNPAILKETMNTLGPYTFSRMNYRPSTLAHDIAFKSPNLFAPSVYDDYLRSLDEALATQDPNKAWIGGPTQNRTDVSPMSFMAGLGQGPFAGQSGGSMFSGSFSTGMTPTSVGLGGFVGSGGADHYGYGSTPSAFDYSGFGDGGFAGTFGGANAGYGYDTSGYDYSGFGEGGHAGGNTGGFSTGNTGQSVGLGGFVGGGDTGEVSIGGGQTSSWGGGFDVDATGPF